jgi:hypothetical protein
VTLRLEPLGVLQRLAGQRPSSVIVAAAEERPTEPEVRQGERLGVLGLARQLERLVVPRSRLVGGGSPECEEAVAVQRECAVTRRPAGAFECGGEERTALRQLARDHPDAPGVGGELHGLVPREIRGRLREVGPGSEQFLRPRLPVTRPERRPG